MTKKVICEICGSLYGIDSQDVIAVDSAGTVISLENVPRFTEGAVMFRGEAVPVLGMRLLFKIDWDPVLSKVPEPEESCIVFMECGDMKIGFRFDRVVELKDIPDGEISKIPLIPSEGSTSYIKGSFRYFADSVSDIPEEDFSENSYRSDERIITVIDPDMLISMDTKKLLTEALSKIEKTDCE